MQRRKNAACSIAEVIGQMLENQYFQGLLVKRRTHVNGAVGYYLRD